jgi:hypothetical protein
MLKNGKGFEQQYLLGNFGDISEAALEGMVLPEGVTRDDYCKALVGDVLGIARKLVTACRASGKRREEFLDTILQGNLDNTWTDTDGNPISKETLQLLRDCEIRWSSTYFMVDRVLTMLPVCFATINIHSLRFNSFLGHQRVLQTFRSIRHQHPDTQCSRGLRS